MPSVVSYSTVHATGHCMVQQSAWYNTLYDTECCSMQCPVAYRVLYHTASCSMHSAVPCRVLYHAVTKCVAPSWVCGAGSDASVVRRTQAGLGAQHKPTVHYSAYFTVPTYLTFLLFAVFGKLLETLAKFSWGRKALLKYPRLFSYGLFSREGPNEQQLAQTRFQMRFIGHGYSQGEAVASAVRVCCLCYLLLSECL